MAVLFHFKLKLETFELLVNNVEDCERVATRATKQIMSDEELEKS